MDEPKKISFGFSKISKKTTLVAPKKEENEIQFIDCLEGNAIKLVNGEEKEKEPLVIPLKNGNILRDNMIEALKLRNEEKKQKNGVNEDDLNKEQAPNTKSDPTVESEEKPLTLDELAAKEILEDLKKSNESEEVKSVLEIPAAGTIASTQVKESSLEDYESIPVNEFGLAMLRGMGWAPDKGVGKNGQVVQPVNPVLRPKGMGLGADKVMSNTVRSASGEELVMKKNASLKVVSGPYKDMYGKIEGFDELPGRLMVRLTLQNIVISINENLVQLVTTEEYNKNSKILNLNDYNKYYEEKNSSANGNENVTSSIKKEYSGGKDDKARLTKLNSSEADADKESTKSSRSYTTKARRYSRSPSSETDKRQVKNSNLEKFREKSNKSKGYKKKANSSSDSEDERKDKFQKEKNLEHSRSSETKYRKPRRDSSSEAEVSHKSYKERRTPSVSCDYEYDKRKTHKSDRRNRSPSSEYEEYKPKDKNYSKTKKRADYSPSPKERSKNKTSSRNRSRSSDSSEEEKRTSSRKHKSEKRTSSHKHKKKDRNHSSESESDARESKHKKHKKHSRQRSRSRSPLPKSKKKHHRSR